MSMREFLQARIDLARRLASGEAGGTYADAVLVATSVLSACAALRWPGNRIDKKRFVELLVRDSPVRFCTSWVSVPALINDGLVHEADSPYGIPGNSCRIYTGSEIDLSIVSAKHTYPQVPLGKLKECCYASLLYTKLRCGYVHEYVPHESITHAWPSRKPGLVSYIRRLTDGKTITMISFDLNYLMDLAEFHVVHIVERTQECPAKWWVDSDKS